MIDSPRDATLGASLEETLVGGEAGGRCHAGYRQAMKAQEWCDRLQASIADMKVMIASFKEWPILPEAQAERREQRLRIICMETERSASSLEILEREVAMPVSGQP